VAQRLGGDTGYKPLASPTNNATGDVRRSPSIKNLHAPRITPQLQVNGEIHNNEEIRAEDLILNNDDSLIEAQEAD